MSKQVEVGDVGRGKSLASAKEALLGAYEKPEVLGRVSLPVDAREFAKQVKALAKGHPGAKVSFVGDEAVVTSS